MENSKSSSGSMAVERADLMTQLEEARALNEQLARERAALERQMADGAEEARAAAGEREASLKRDLEAQLQKARQEGAEKARAELTGVQVGSLGHLFSDRKLKLNFYADCTARDCTFQIIHDV